MRNEFCTIISQDMIADRIFKLVLEGELTREMAEPGRFVHVKPDLALDPLLRRPISICDVDVDKRQFTLLYRIEGKGTTKLSTAAAGAQVDVLGPLGSGFPVQATKPGETALLVGGGIGVPPLYYLSKQLKAQGTNVVHVLGFGSAKDVFYEQQFAELGSTYISTVDGTEGTQGFVTDVIDAFGLTFDTLYACGPTAMLKALEARYRDTRGFLSLEERMGCGVGACLACVCRLQNDPEGASYRKVCTDGPVFPIGEVIL